MSEGRRRHLRPARAAIGALVGAVGLVLASSASVAQETTTTSTTTTTTTTEPPITVAAVTAFTKTFTPDSIVSGGTSTLTFDITTDADDTGIGFTDPLPSGMTVATTATSPQCGGTVTASDGSSTITFSGGAINTTTCTITVDVTAAEPGEYINTTSDITWDGGTLAGATDTLFVAPEFTKAFSPDTIDPNGISTLTFTIDNTGNPDPVTGLAFSDTLPTSPGAMVVASTPNEATTCGGTWSPAGGEATLTFTGGDVAANDTCTVSVDVTAPTAGTYENTSEVLQSTELPDSDPATASLVVTPLVVTKTFVEGSIPSGGTATFNITIRNDGTEAVNDVVADDPLATGCNRTFTTIAAGASETYSCTQANVTTAFTNTITVTGTTDLSGVVVSAVATAAVTVAAAAVPAAAGPALAVTGSSTGPLTGIGIGALALGSLLVLSSSNRRRLFRRT